ncbi:hypothetical protein AB4039_05240 [Streptomyces sp. M-16]
MFRRAREKGEVLWSAATVCSRQGDDEAVHAYLAQTEVALSIIGMPVRHQEPLVLRAHLAFEEGRMRRPRRPRPARLRQPAPDGERRADGPRPALTGRVRAVGDQPLEAPGTGNVTWTPDAVGGDVAAVPPR